MPLTILVVDDDLGIRVAVGDYLETLGFVVTSVSNGWDALEGIAQVLPHLLVVDIAMPQMSGYELVRRVRSEGSMRLLPVIFLTERNETADRIVGYQVGCDSYLAKPFELEELATIVKNLLDRNHLLDRTAISNLDSPNLDIPNLDIPNLELGAQRLAISVAKPC